MAEQFDPYYTWLGIPPDEQPADYYRLLGVRRFESSPDVIQNASDQRIAFLRSVQTGPRMRYSQQLLGEVAAAAGCLLDPQRKPIYDETLRNALRLHTAAAPPIPPAVSVASAAPVEEPQYASAPPPASPPFSPAISRRTKTKGIPLTPVMIGLGGLAGLIAGAVILQHAFEINLLTLQKGPGPVADSSTARSDANPAANKPVVNQPTQPGSAAATSAPAANSAENRRPTNEIANSSPPASQSTVRTSTKSPAALQQPPGSAPTSSAVTTPQTAGNTPNLQTTTDASQPAIPALPRSAVVAEIPYGGQVPGHIVLRPDGKFIAHWNRFGKEVGLCPVANPQARTSMQGSQIIFSSDNRQFVVIQPRRGAHFYRFATGGKLTESALAPITEIVRAASFSDDGKQFFAAISGARPLAALIVTTQKLNDRIKTTLPDVAWLGAASDLVVCSTSSGEIEMIPLAGARQHDSLPEPLGAPPILAFDHAGSPSLLAYASAQPGQLKLDVWNLKSKTRVTTPVLREGSSRADLLAVSNDGQLAAVRGPRTLSLVRLPSGQQMTQLQWPDGDFEAAAMTTADGVLAVNGPANHLWVIDLSQLSAQPVWRLLQDDASVIGGPATGPTATATSAPEVKAPTAAEQRALARSLPKGTFDAVFVKPGGASSGGKDLVDGWEFIPKATMTVTHLGIYDDRLNGLSTAHDVAIWDLDEPSTPVITATVPPGVQAPAAGMFHLVPVKRVKLDAGKTYAVVAYYPTADDEVVSLFNPGGLMIEYAPQINVVGRRSAYPKQQMAFPDKSDHDPAHAMIGPTFRFEVR